MPSIADTNDPISNLPPAATGQRTRPFETHSFRAPAPIALFHALQRQIAASETLPDSHYAHLASREKLADLLKGLSSNRPPPSLAVLLDIAASVGLTLIAVPEVSPAKNDSSVQWSDIAATLELWAGQLEDACKSGPALPRSVVMRCRSLVQNFRTKLVHGCRVRMTRTSIISLVHACRTFRLSPILVATECFAELENSLTEVAVASTGIDASPASDDFNAIMPSAMIEGGFSDLIWGAAFNERTRVAAREDELAPDEYPFDVAFEDHGQYDHPVPRHLASSIKGQIAFEEACRLLPDDRTTRPDQFHEQSDLKRHLAKILLDLPPRQERIIRQLYGIGCRELSKLEVAELFRLTTSRIDQIEAIALKKLAKLTWRRGLTPFLFPSTAPSSVDAKSLPPPIIASPAMQQLAKQTGLAKSELRQFMISSGIAGFYLQHIPSSEHAFDAAATDILAGKITGLLSTTEAADHLGASQFTFENLVKNELLKPRLHCAKLGLAPHYAKTSVDNLLRRLLLRTPPTQAPRLGQYNIPAAARVVDCTETEIVNLILEGRLTPAGRLENVRGYVSILLGIEAVRLLIRGKKAKKPDTSPHPPDPGEPLYRPTPLQEIGKRQETPGRNAFIVPAKIERSTFDDYFDIPPQAVLVQEARPERLLKSSELAAYIGCNERSAHMFVDEGFIRPYQPADNDALWDGRYRENLYADVEMDAFLKMLAGNVYTRRHLKAGMSTIPRAAATAECTESDIIRLIQQGNLKAIAKIGPSPSYLGIMIDIDELSMAIGHRSRLLTPKRVAAILDVSEFTVLRLMEEGHLKKSHRRTKVAKKSGPLVKYEEMTRFHEKYISLSSLCRRGVTRYSYALRFAKSGVRPAFDPNLIQESIYLREQAAPRKRRYTAKPKDRSSLPGQPD